jgi:hypothetical protein
MKSRGLTVINYVMVAAFVLCAAVQLNDPDSWIWVGIYAVAAGISLGVGARLLPWWVPASALVASVTVGVVLATQAEGVSWDDLTSRLSMKTLEVEKAREAGGLLITGAWMGVLTFVAAKTKGKAA